VAKKKADTTTTVTKAKKAKERPNCYHDPLRLLKAYRDVRWNLKLSMEHHRQDFEDEYGMSITEYLDDVYAAGAGFIGICTNIIGSQSTEAFVRA